MRRPVDTRRVRRPAFYVIWEEDEVEKCIECEAEQPRGGRCANCKTVAQFDEHSPPHLPLLNSVAKSVRRIKGVAAVFADQDGEMILRTKDGKVYVLVLREVRLPN